jgi:regulator of replication initiation timing
MLSMLTEGLKEVWCLHLYCKINYLHFSLLSPKVESSQLQWLNTNAELSQDLDKALEQNVRLRHEVRRLRVLLGEYHSGSSELLKADLEEVNNVRAVDGEEEEETEDWASIKSEEA